MKKGMFVSSLSVLALLAACGNGGDASENVELEFFQFKQEAVTIFDQLIEEFEAENPGITITQNNVPESDTVLLSRLTQNDLPDILGINGGALYGELVRAGVLEEVTGDEQLDRTLPGYSDMISLIAGTDSEGDFAFPHSTNANGVIYNKAIFDEVGVEIPTTWDELIEVAEQLETAGHTPFYSTYGEPWTILPPLNALASNTHGDDFFTEIAAGETSFTERYDQVADKLTELLTYTDNDVFGSDYNRGNSEFAQGASAMYLQGIWAMGPIQEANPDIELGVFPLPVTNTPEENDIVSGVDLVLALPEGGEHNEEARQFIDFLLEEDSLQTYIDDQKLFSAVEGPVQSEPSLAELQPIFDAGQITSFADHYYPQGMGIENIFQQYLLDGDKEALLEELDSEYQRLANQ